MVSFPPAQRRMIGFPLPILCAALLNAAAWATPVISTTSRGGTSATGTGAAITCRAPCPVVVDAGSGTQGGLYDIPQNYTDYGVRIVRFDENAYAGVTFTDATKTLSKTASDMFSTLSWEKLDCQNLDVGAGWTASGADAGALYDNGTSVHGKPIAIKLNNAAIAEGAIGALANEQWAWGDVDTIGASRIYVQSAATTPTIHAIYGDGTHLLISGTGVTFGFFEIDDKTSDDAVTMVADINSGAANPSDLVVGQGVAAFTDLEYIWTTSCTGGVCVEDITNGDQRPGAATTVIDETKGYGPIWAWVFAEGFGVGTITLTVNDLTNGGTDTQTITVTETNWSTTILRYVASTGDDTDGTTLGKAWNQAEDCINWLRTAVTPCECVFLANDTTTMVASPTTWNNISGDRRIRSSIVGTKAIVSVPTTIVFFASSGTTSADTSIMDIDINKSGTTGPLDINTSRLAILRVDVNAAGASPCLSLGQPNYVAIDTVVWDSTFTTNVTAAGIYPIFAPHSDTATAAADSQRRAYMGNHLDFKGGEHNFRTWPYIMIAAYNEFEHDGTPSATKDNLKLMCGADPESFQSRYAYLYGNYIYISSTSTVDINAIDLDDDTGGNLGHVDYLFDSNYIENQNTGTTLSHVAMTIKSSKNIRIQNNVFDNFTKNVSASTPIAGFAGHSVMLFHNSLWTNKATTVNFTKDGGGASDRFANLKVINNAGSANSSTAGNIVQNNSTIGTIESTQILQNIWDWGTVTSAWDVDTSSGGFAGAGWPAQAFKEAQLNYTITQGKDNDPGFTDPASNDFTISGGSICVNNARTLATIKRDYRGYIRPEPAGTVNDVGARENGATFDGAAAGTGGAATRGMLIGVW